MKNKKEKVKIVYPEDKGETIYSMAPLEGLTPEELEERSKKNEKPVKVTKKEKFAMTKAAFEVYLPVLLCICAAFTVAAVVLYLLMK